MINYSETKWIHSIFTRLFIILLIIMVMMLIIGIGIFKWSSTQLSKEMYKPVEIQVSNYMNNFDGEIQKIKQMQIDLTQDEDVNKIANAYSQMDNFDRTSSILRIQRRLTVIKDSSIFISNVRIFVPSIKWSINDLDYKGGGYTELTDSEIAELNRLSTDSDSQLIYQNGRLFLFVVYPSYGLAEPSFWIEIELSIDTIRNTLTQLDNYKDSGFILENPSRGFLVESVSNGRLEQQLQGAIKSQNNSGMGTISMNIDGNQYLLINKTSDYSKMTLLLYLPESIVLGSLTKLEMWYWALFLLVIITIVLYSIYSFRFIRKPLTKLILAFKKVESGDFQTFVDYPKRDEIGYLYSHFNEMVNNLKTLIDQAYKQKILMQKAELKQLQSQINPHFLYNSYFLLHRIIKRKDYENAVKFSKEMGAYFQFITRSASDVVSMKSEVEHARIYAGIQAMRFEGRIAVEFGEVPKEAAEIRIPRLILQPIVENAFEHGLENKQVNGLLRVTFRGIPGGVQVIVEDNGDDLKENDIVRLRADLDNDSWEKETTGMININRRLSMFCGKGSGIQASRSDLGGLRVEMTIMEVREAQ